MELSGRTWLDQLGPGAMDTKDVRHTSPKTTQAESLGVMKDRKDKSQKGLKEEKERNEGKKHPQKDAKRNTKTMMKRERKGRMSKRRGGGWESGKGELVVAFMEMRR